MTPTALYIIAASLLAFVPPCIAGTMTASSSSPATTSSTPGTERIHNGTPSRVSLIFTDDNSLTSMNISSHEDALTLDGYVYIGGSINCTRSEKWTIHLTTLNQQALLETYFGCDMSIGPSRLKNSTTTPIGGYLKSLRCSDTTCVVGAVSEYITVPAMATCGAIVNNLDLGNATPGSTGSYSLPITFSGTGTGQVTISGQHLQTSGELFLGGSKNVIVSPVNDSNVDTNTGKWIISDNDNTIRLKSVVSNTAQPGVNTSTMTATLSCE